MSLFNRNRYSKKLAKALSRAGDEDFIQMIWSIDALQSNRVDAAARYINFPPEAATSKMDSQFVIYKWELETLVSLFLLTPKQELRDGLNRITNCRRYGTCVQMTNYLRDIENEEAKVQLKHRNVLDELPRIGHREFPWQRGFDNAPQLYRYAYIYGQGDSADYFKQTYGLTIDDFSLVGFALWATFQEFPLQKKPTLNDLGIAPSVVEMALKLLSMPIEEARIRVAAMVRDINSKYGAPQPTAYQPSLLRQYPIIEFGGLNAGLRSPIPNLIILRTTSGLFYDLIKGGSHLRNESGERFEKYCADYISATMPRFEIKRSSKYQFRGNAIDTPDILIKDKGKVIATVECKSTKLNFDAQFAENPIEQAKTGFEEITKGVFQLWRYFSHARRGLVDSGDVNSGTRGLLLTLDAWLVLSPNTIKDIFAKATEMTERDSEILPEDRRKISFCNIQELEFLLSRTDENGFLAVLSAADEDRFANWGLPEVRREIGEKAPQPKPFPFEIKDVLPWWHRVEELKQEREKRSAGIVT